MTRTWTKTPNGPPGWYWFKDAEGPYKGYPIPLEICQLGPGITEDRNGEWLGPITPEDVARADGCAFTVAAGPGTVVTGECEAGKPIIDYRAELDEQTAADAAVGRKLREISEAVRRKYDCCTSVSMWDGVVQQVSEDERSLGGESGPDALDRAHAEVCGEGLPPGFIDEAPGVTMADLDSLPKPAHAKPDYASMSDEDLLRKLCVTTVPGGDGPFIYDDGTDQRDALRAALIAFLEQRPTKPAR